MNPERGRSRRDALRSGALRGLRALDLRILIAAPLVTAALWVVMAAGVFRPGKAALESAAIVVLASALAIAGLRLVSSRDAFLLWGGALLGLLLIREIHFTGSDTILVVGLVVLAAFLIFENRPLRSRLADRWTLNLLVLGFLIYAISQTVDQRWWAAIPAESVVNVPLEETLELLGHATVGGAVALCGRAGPSTGPSAGPSTGPSAGPSTDPSADPSAGLNAEHDS